MVSICFPFHSIVYRKVMSASKLYFHWRHTCAKFLRTCVRLFLHSWSWRNIYWEMTKHHMANCSCNLNYQIDRNSLIRRSAIIVLIVHNHQNKNISLWNIVPFTNIKEIKKHRAIGLAHARRFKTIMNSAIYISYCPSWSHIWQSSAHIEPPLNILLIVLGF